MIPENYSSKLLILTIALMSLLSSCTFTKVYNETVDSDHSILDNTSIITPKLDIDSVFFKGRIFAYRPYVRFDNSSVPDSVDTSNDIQYLALFKNFEHNLTTTYNYYYRLNASKPTFVHETLESILEEPYVWGYNCTKVNANIVKFDLDENITFDESRFIQTLEIDFSYIKDGEEINYLTHSTDTITLKKAHLSKIDDLIYTGIYNCAHQFSDHFCKNNGIDTNQRNHPFSPHDNYRSLDRKINDYRSDNQPFQEINNTKKTHPSVRVGGIYLPATDYGAELSVFLKQKTLGSYTPSIMIRFTNNFLTAGFAPLFYTNRHKEGLYFTASLNLAYYFSKQYSYYNYYDSFSFKTDPIWAVSSTFGFGWRNGILDVRFGGLGFLMISDNTYNNTDSQLFAGIGLCF